MKTNEKKNAIRWGQKEWAWASTFAYMLTVASSFMINKSTDTEQWILFSLITFVGFIVVFKYIHLVTVLKNKKHSLFLLEFLMLVVGTAFYVEIALTKAGLIGEKYWQSYTMTAFFLLFIAYAIIWAKETKKE